MKKGVQFKPRDTDCTAEMAPICIWNSELEAKLNLSRRIFCIIGPTCPTNFELNVGEEDGRSCYSVIPETPSSVSSEALQVSFHRLAQRDAAARLRQYCLKTMK